MELENINPNIYKKLDSRLITSQEEDDEITDEFDAREIFGIFKLLNKLQG